MGFVIKSVLIGVAATAAVLYEGRSGHSLKLPAGQEIAKLTFEEPVRVGGPVWAHVEPPNTPIASPPQDPIEILSDFLPSILGFPDGGRLSVILDYLYHPEETVRRYAANGLGYWSDDEVQRHLSALTQTRGPSDVFVDRTLSAAPELAEAMFRHLRSDNPVIVRGAVNAASLVVSNHQQLFSNAAKARAEEALLAAAEHVMRVGDGQTINNFAAALGAMRDERSHQILWDFVRRRVAYEQSLIAIPWRKDLKDLPRLAAILDAPATGDPSNSDAL